MTALSQQKRSDGLAGFGSVLLGKSLLWTSEDVLTVYIMIMCLHLPPALAGGLFLAGSLWNALCDGMIGYALGRWQWLVRWLPVTAAGGLLVGVSGFGFLPLMQPGNWLAVAALLFLFRTGYSLMDVPHNGLTTRFADMKGHLGIARLRAVGSALPALAVGAVCIPIMRDPHGAAQDMPVLVAIIALAALVMMAPLPWLLSRYPLSFPSGGKEGRFSGPDTDSKGTGLLLFCVVSMLGYGGIAAGGKALLHIDFPAPDAAAGGMVLITVCRLSAAWLWTPVGRHMGYGAALGVAYGASAVTILLFPLLLGGTAAGVFLAFSLFGLAVGGVGMLSWAVLTEVIAEGKTGLAGSGQAPAYGYFTMAMKAGSGLSGLVLGFWLAAYGDMRHVRPDDLWLMAALSACACLVAMLALLWRHSVSNLKVAPLPGGH